MYGFDLSFQGGLSEEGRDHVIVEAEKLRTKGIMV